MSDILFLSFDDADRDAVGAALAEHRHRVTVADSAAAALSELGGIRPSAVLVDLRGRSEALRFLRTAASQQPRVPLVAIADRGQADLAGEALRLGALDVVTRPLGDGDLAAALANAREMSALASRGAHAATDAMPDGILAVSAAMRVVVDAVRRVASSRCSALIVGEPGSGRELVARTIHARSAHNGRPFLKVPCASITTAELEGLLTGPPHGERSANGSPWGSIFLDRLCDLAPELQRVLERWLTQHEAGAAEGHHNGFRILASAQPRIDDFVARARIRRDLIDALAVVRIDLPPLRHRPQDIPLLAGYFLKIACRGNETPPKVFSRSALALLAALPWRGNATELRDLTERLAVLVPRGVVLQEDVLQHVKLDRLDAPNEPQTSLREARDSFERDFIVTVLQRHRGRMGATAKELGLERTNLYRKLKQLNIVWRGR